MSNEKKESFEVIGVNRRARFDYFILEAIEAGIELKGSEVKSLREGGVTLQEGYAHVRGGQAFLEGVHIKPYTHAGPFGPEPVRSRRLLMHRREILRLHAEIQEKRYTLVPLRLYFKNGRAKVELGLAKGKKVHDKRETLKANEARRSLERAQRRTRT